MREKEITQEGNLSESDVKSDSFDKIKQEMLNWNEIPQAVYHTVTVCYIWADVQLQRHSNRLLVNKGRS